MCQGHSVILLAFEKQLISTDSFRASSPKIKFWTVPPSNSIPLPHLNHIYQTYISKLVLIITSIFVLFICSWKIIIKTVWSITGNTVGATLSRVPANMATDELYARDFSLSQSFWGSKFEPFRQPSCKKIIIFWLKFLCDSEKAFPLLGYWSIATRNQKIIAAFCTSCICKRMINWTSFVAIHSL